MHHRHRMVNMGHLSDVNKSYFGHMSDAWKMAFWFALGAVRLVIHGVLPNIDVSAGQSTVDHYHPMKTD
jgi:hypothetical protein